MTIKCLSVGIQQSIRAPLILVRFADTNKEQGTKDSFQNNEQLFAAAIRL